MWITVSRVSPQRKHVVLTTVLFSQDSDFWCRMCCAPIRPWKQTVTLGDQAGGQPIIKMDVPMACHPSPIQCCFHKTMTIMDGNDSPLGQAEVPFFWCIPVVKLHDQTGNHKYNIHMPTCWGGLCVDCCAEGCCNCKVRVQPHTMAFGTRFGLRHWYWHVHPVVVNNRCCTVSFKSLCILNHQRFRSSFVLG